MTPEMRVRARKSLDQRILKLPDPVLIGRPPLGWIRAIRQSIGMTTAQLAKRMGVSQPRIPVLEKAEATKSITLESLERAAKAMDCELVYLLVPRTTFQEQVERRAKEVATKQAKTIQHTMALENQSVSANERDNQVKSLARSLSEKSGSELWNDE